ncbi:Uncharacterized phage protein gp47/JayE [Roseomonas rosea]|uniref:Uncharacterized phage protein gp47/JayE n=1 Tax=Muricoccus roseus TaxID=198092 RepID=A0A1M6LDY1_9PROT|nr:baseplate J/gp47 family protein [Roseomonas rosea]SHJ69404.1 Uncharacterized phage protein gp47/JayE [Roseomonas rosea]
MAFERPTLTALVRQAREDMAAIVGGVVLRASPLAIMAKAMAGLVHGLYGYLDWIALQATPFTATGAFLVAWGALVGVLRKDAATATAQATFTGAPGSQVPDGTRLARSADGLSYRTTALGTVGANGTVTLPIEAEEAGAVGNALQGAQLALSGALSGVTSAATLATPATGGADEEGEEAFRARILARYAEPPQGGAPSDYTRWAMEVAGVTRAWVAPSGAGAGTVVVYVMLDDAQAAHDGFPQGTDGVAGAETRGIAATGDQRIVADHLFPLRPATALVHVVSPIPYPVDITISDLAADSSATRAAIETALRAMFRREGSPGGTIYQNDLFAAVDGVDGVERFTLSTSSITPPTGHLPVLGTLSWA